MKVTMTGMGRRVVNRHLALPERRRKKEWVPSGVDLLEGRQLLHGGIAGLSHHLAPPVSTDYRAPVPVRNGSETSHRNLQRGPVAKASKVTGAPDQVGSWSRPVKFRPPGAPGPYLAIHSTLLPNGEVLAWPHDYNYFLATKRAAPYTPNIISWNPVTNRYASVTLRGDNLFCSGHTFLADGRLIVLGGHGPAEYAVKGLQTAYGQNHTEIYDFRTGKWSAAQNMGEGRYYGSAITLGNGDALVLAGYSEEGYNNASIEIYNPISGWRTLTGANTAKYPDWYPHIYQLSNGLVFGVVPGKRTFMLDPSGDGQISAGPTMNYPRRYYGTSVMYAEDKIIAIGGNAAPGRAGAGGNNLITKTAEIIDLKSSNPTWKYTAPMRSPRWFANATLLPDGTVLVTGGTRQQTNKSGNALAGAVYSAESWNPQTGQWTTYSSMKVPRMYHSTALLLPDGRILVAGGGQPEMTGEAKGTIHDNMQIFSPPYLFKGPRPVIESAPDSAGYGQTIQVSSPDAASIKSINLIRLGSTTHAFNMTQRGEPLAFSRGADGQLDVQLPSNPNAAPPGYYMLFLLNEQGVPSVAKIMELKQA